MTSKLQLTVPKAVANQYGIRPGDELEWIPAGDTIRVVLKGRTATARKRLSLKQRLELFDQATKRQRQRNKQFSEENPSFRPEPERGWRREDLYTRGFPR